MKGTSHKFIKYLFFSLLTVYIFLAVLDFSLRLFKYFIYDDLKKFSDIKSGRSLFKYDKYLGYTLNPNYKDTQGISINSFGFRGKEVQQEKNKSIYRIIVLGDSIAFGYQENSSTWPSRLEFLLNKSKKDNQNNFEVINAGITGYTTIQAKRLFETKLIKFSPDMIIVSLGWNDVIFATSQSWSPDIPIKSLSRIKFVRRLDNFMFVKLFNELWLRTKAFLKMDHPQKSLINEEALISFENNLTEIIRIAKDKNIKIALTTMPTVLQKNMSQEEKDKTKQKTFKTSDDMMSAFERFNDVIKKVALHNNVALVESRFSSFDISDKNQYFIDYCHFNDEGNDKFAAEIYQKLFN